MRDFVETTGFAWDYHNLLARAPASSTEGFLHLQRIPQKLHVLDLTVRLRFRVECNVITQGLQGGIPGNWSAHDLGYTKLQATVCDQGLAFESQTPGPLGFAFGLRHCVQDRRFGLGAKAQGLGPIGLRVYGLSFKARLVSSQICQLTNQSINVLKNSSVDSFTGGLNPAAYSLDESSHWQEVRLFEDRSSPKMESPKLDLQQA